MSWRIVYIEEADYLSLHLDNLKVTKGNDDTTIPLGDINSIIIDNYKTTLSVNLLNKCMDYKINVVLCDMKHLPNTIIYPYSGNYQASLVLKNQLSWKEENINKAWQIIVKGKIINQIKVLKENNKSIDVINKLSNYLNEIEPLDATNREGLAAKLYFKELFGNNFLREDENTINACLNYGYSIIRSMIARSLVAKGLNPHIGIFHKGQFNDFNLADDIIEVFRPIIDNYVYNNFLNEQFFTRDIRLKIVSSLIRKILYNGKKQSISNVISSYVDNILSALNTGSYNNIYFPEVKIYDI